MPLLFNRVRMATATTGTGTMTLGSAVTGYQTFANDGVADGDVVRYIIEDTGNAWEIGYGTYSTTGPTLTRNLVKSSTGALLNLSGGAEVFSDAVKQDLKFQWEYISKSTLSGASTYEFTAFDPVRYDTYLFEFENLLPSSDDKELRGRSSTNGGSTWDSGSNNYYDSGASGSTYIELSYSGAAGSGVGNDAGEEGVTGKVIIRNAGVAKKTVFEVDVSHFKGDGSFSRYADTWVRDSAADVDGFQVYYESGTFSGIVRVWGGVAYA